MPRRHRSYLPGTPFHITSRVIGREHWLDEPTRDFALEVIADSLRRSDARLIAFAIMPNHLHLVARQGRMHLAQLMQPLLCRLAIYLKRRLRRTGHIFEQRYFERPCADPDYLRNAIAYTHLNPKRAGLCADPIEYRWTSHHRYCGQPKSPPDPFEIISCLECFADVEGCSTAEQQHNYLRFLAARDVADGDGVTRHRPPSVAYGDLCWAAEFGSRKQLLANTDAGLRPDLHDLVRHTLAERAPGLSLAELRLLRFARPLTTVRREIIERAIRAGYRRVDVARYLHVSQSLVSKVSVSMTVRPPTDYRVRLPR